MNVLASSSALSGHAAASAQLATAAQNSAYAACIEQSSGSNGVDSYADGDAFAAAPAPTYDPGTMWAFGSPAGASEGSAGAGNAGSAGAPPSGNGNGDGDGKKAKDSLVHYRSFPGEQPKAMTYQPIKIGDQEYTSLEGPAKIAAERMKVGAAAQMVMHSVLWGAASAMKVATTPGERMFPHILKGEDGPGDVAKVVGGSVWLGLFSSMLLIFHEHFFLAERRLPHDTHEMKYYFDRFLAHPEVIEHTNDFITFCTAIYCKYLGSPESFSEFHVRWLVTAIPFLVPIGVYATASVPIYEWASKRKEKSAKELRCLRNTGMSCDTKIENINDFDPKHVAIWLIDVWDAARFCMDHPHKIHLKVFDGALYLGSRFRDQKNRRIYSLPSMMHGDTKAEKYLIEQAGIKPHGVNLLKVIEKYSLDSARRLAAKVEVNWHSDALDEEDTKYAVAWLAKMGNGSAMDWVRSWAQSGDRDAMRLLQELEKGVEIELPVMSFEPGTAVSVELIDVQDGSVGSALERYMIEEAGERPDAVRAIQEIAKRDVGLALKLAVQVEVRWQEDDVVGAKIDGELHWLAEMGNESALKLIRSFAENAKGDAVDRPAGKAPELFRISDDVGDVADVAEAHKSDDADDEDFEVEPVVMDAYEEGGGSVGGNA